MNHREGERSPTDLPVTIYGLNRDPIHARLLDVSMSGAGIEYPDCVDVHPMETVELLISSPCPKDLEPVRIAGFVARRGSGWMGVMFMSEAPWLPRRLGAAAGRSGRSSIPTARAPVLSGLSFSDS
jgi:hypothetical protein